MIFLKNELGKELKPTPVAKIVTNFFIELFNIEHRDLYHSKDKFMIGDKGERRNLYHVTKTDLMVAVYLNVVCSTTGRIDVVTLHELWNGMKKFFEKPVVFVDFQYSIEKFKLLGLLTMEADEIVTHKVTITLQHYINPETNKIHNFVIAHPIVFSQAFFKRSVAHWKVYFSYILQVQTTEALQEDKRRYFNSYNKENPMHMNGLKSFLHKHTAMDIRKVLDDLVKDPILEGQPLFSKMHYATAHNTNSKTQNMVYMRLNPFYFCKAQKGEEYQHNIERKKVYTRTFRYISKVFNELGIGELVSLKNYKEIANILYPLKEAKRSQILYVALCIKQKIKSLIHTSQKAEMPLWGRYIKNVLKASNPNMDTVYKQGLGDYISHDLKGEKKTVREFEFAYAISRYPKEKFAELCDKVKEAITQISVPDKVALENYQLLGGLDSREDLKSIPARAYLHQIDITAYTNLCRKAMNRYIFDSSFKLKEWFTTELDKLARATIEMKPMYSAQTFKFEEVFECVHHRNYDKLKRLLDYVELEFIREASA